MHGRSAVPDAEVVLDAADRLVGAATPAVDVAEGSMIAVHLGGDLP
jgi:hypothetical protein